MKYVDHLKKIYVNIIYKLASFIVDANKKVFLHLINIEGLDPNSNPEAEKARKFQEELNKVFNYDSRNILRVPIGGSIFKNLTNKAFKIQN